MPADVTVLCAPTHWPTSTLESLKEQKLYRHLRILDGEQKAHTTVNHTSVVNLSSNNYLGLTTHPKLRERALEAVRLFGVGDRIGADDRGPMEMHMELERRLARFKKVEKVVVFQSGFTANAGTVSAILTKDDVVISDELNHASIIDGCRLSRANNRSFPAQRTRAEVAVHAEDAVGDEQLALRPRQLR